jgi:hypothetical protein
VLTVIAVILAAYRMRQHHQAQTEMMYDVGSMDGSTDWRSSIWQQQLRTLRCQPHPA